MHKLAIITEIAPSCFIGIFLKKYGIALQNALHLCGIQYSHYFDKTEAVLIDSQGFRANVGIVITTANGQVFWGRKVGKAAWQFPQGGLQSGEAPIDAMYRELAEEVGLQAKDVIVLQESAQWYAYQLPQHFIRRNVDQICIGQKQKWFLLRLLSHDSCIRLDDSEEPEFDCWRWVDYWYPAREVIFFKRQVYQDVLCEFADCALRQV